MQVCPEVSSENVLSANLNRFKRDSAKLWALVGRLVWLPRSSRRSCKPDRCLLSLQLHDSCRMKSNSNMRGICCRRGLFWAEVHSGTHVFIRRCQLVKRSGQQRSQTFYLALHVRNIGPFAKIYAWCPEKNVPKFRSTFMTNYNILGFEIWKSECCDIFVQLWLI